MTTVGQSRVSRVSVSDDIAPIVFRGIRPSWAPLAKQSVVAGLVIAAAVASSVLPLLTVTAAMTMWGGVACAVAGWMFATTFTWWPRAVRAELLIPALDFVAVGLLRFGTGESRSVFLPIVVLPVIWIAAKSGRQHIVYPLMGTSVTLLLPYVLSPDPPHASELVRLVVALLVYAAAASVTNELARQANLRLDIADRQRHVAENEIVQAAVVQQSLQPGSAHGLPPEIDAVGVCVPAKRVGGDFYDWFPTSAGAAFTLGDVMGKGVGAGMIATAVRSVIRSTVDDADASSALRRAAVGLTTGDSDILSGQFTTCFHLRLSRDGTADWADAGHGLTLIRRVDGGREFLRSADLPIGIGASWASNTAVLANGDMIVSISDGVLDLFGSDALTIERFETFLDRFTTATAIVDELGTLARDTDHPDDVTILAVTYRGT